MSSLVEAFGRRTINSINHLLDLLAFTYRLISIALKRPKAGRRLVLKFTLEQIYFTAVQALPVLVFVSLITGSMMVIQFVKYFAMVEGEYILGDLIVILVVRELGPLFTALIVILRSAVAVTVEASYMTISGEFDAIEMQGMSPLYLICLPRLVGITVAMLSLFLIFDMVAIIGGYGVAWIADVPVKDFLQKVGKAVSVTDITVGIVKAIFFGFTIAVTSLYHGFHVKEGVTQVPSETSKAAIECLLYCMFVNIIISVIFYV